MSHLSKIVTVVILAIVLILFCFCFSCDANTNPNALISKIDQVENNYKNYCAGCHGDNLEKFRNENWMFASTHEEIAEIIRKGEEDMGMPAFEVTFTKEEIDELTTYILDAGKKKQKEADPIVSETTNKSSGTPFWTETIITGLDSPWGMEFLPNGDILIAEKSGKLSRYTEDKELIEILGLPNIRVGGQGGLMDLQLHPKYKENGWIYISYSYFADSDEDEGNTAIIRARMKGNKLIDIETIYKGIPALSTRHHYGSRIEFDNEGYLYFSIGDRGKRDIFPQTLDNSNGKVHRLLDDGSVPADNPFIRKKDAEASIYSYGHRNIQGMAKHPQSGEIWTHEHGPKGGDEINIIEKGQNYGWPIISYGINYNGTKFTDITEKKGMLQPLIYYVPSIAPCGMAFVTSDKYPGWENNLLIGSLRFKYLERCVVENNQVVDQERILEGIGRVRNVKLSPDGYIYVAVEEPGKILKLIPLSKD